jgi:hypothetical protein
MRARDNPFRTERLLALRYRLQGGTWEELLRRCQTMHYRGALIGPHGSGKTTLIEDLQPRLRERGFGTRLIRLDADHRTFAPGFLRALFAEIASGDILLFDGAEQMNPLAWSWFLWCARRAAGLIVTTHHAGRLPTLWECRTSPVMLAGIAADLLEVPVDTLRDEAERLFWKHRGNLRDALWEWYDWVAEARPHCGVPNQHPPGYP